MEWSGTATIGITLTDGASAKAGKLNCFSKHAFDPAKKITRVEVIFNRSENEFMQTNFFSGEERLVSIGLPDNLVKDWEGRKETFEMADDEQLIGCELGCNDFYFLSVRWLAIKVPKRIMEEILVQEMEALKIREQ